jgi:hypothetical protein
MNSIAFHESSIILAGDYNDNQVYVCLNPTASTPKFERLNTLKQPGGDLSPVTVGWNGDTAVAATQGNEGCFATSADNGYSWNDISMINTQLLTMSDFAVSADGSVLYLATNDGSDVSIWVKASAWTRIFSSTVNHGATINLNFLVRIAPEDSDAVYIASPEGTTGTDSKEIWVSKNMGKTTWKHVPCYKVSTIIDFVVKDADTVFVLDTDDVSKTTNAGASWGSAKKLDVITGNMITLAPNGDILVGGNGYINFSKDNGSTFTRSKEIESGDTTPNHVVASSKYADDNTIFVAYGDTSGGTINVKKGKADGTSSFSTRSPGTEILTSALTVCGFERYEDIYYVLFSDTAGTNGEIQRALDLETAPTSGLANWSGISTSADFVSCPKALQISEGSIMLWMIDTDSAVSEETGDSSSVADDELYTLKDVSAQAPPTVTAPATGTEVPINPIFGKAYNVTLTWERYSTTKIDDFELQIATDADFTAIVLNVSVAWGMASNTISQVVGPTGPSGYVVDFNPGTTYYWRVRIGTGGVLLSPWSEVRNFKIGPDVSFGIASPEAGATGVSITPSFVWAPYPDAISYEIMVAEDSTFAILDFSHGTDNTFYQAAEALSYSTTYYWRVRGVTGPAPAKGAAPGGPWAEGMFTTEAAPAEPEPPPPPPATTTVIIPTPGPTQTVPVPQPAPIPSYILWVIVAIGAALIIALIILIVRTRRVV